MAETITITTEALRKRKEEWLEDLGELEKSFAGIETSFHQLEQFFCGKPVGELKTRGLREQREGMNALTQLRAQIEKTEEIAAVYDQAERSNQNVITDN